MKRRLFLTAAAFWGIFALITRSKAYYTGNSPHFKDGVFGDAESSAPKSFAQLLKWQSESRENKQPWPENLLLKQQDKPPKTADFRVTFIGHATWLYQIQGVNILIDPVFSEKAGPFGLFGPKRVTPPGVAMKDLPPLDYILITHNHYDHLDGAALQALSQKHRVEIVSPLGNDAIIADFVGETPQKTLDWGQSVTLKHGITLHCEPCRHWSARGLFDRNKALWACFVLQTKAGNILHIGDTGFGSGVYFRRLKDKFNAFSLAILPIGAYEPRWFMADQHVNPQEAVEIFKLTNTKTALASHWGCFQLTDEGRDAPIVALKATGIAKERFRVLEVGEAYTP